MHKQDLVNQLEFEKTNNLWSLLAEDDTGAQTEFCTSININSNQWIEFAIQNFDDALQEFERVRDHFSQKEKNIAKNNIKLGRNIHNTFELNYGVNGKTSQQMLDILGADNLIKIGLNPHTTMARLVLHQPGHGIAWHIDKANRYQKAFPNADKNKLKRFWFSAIDWQPGHIFQLGDSVLHHWSAGDVYSIPFGLPHASINFGTTTKFTVNLTGELYEDH